MFVVCVQVGADSAYGLLIPMLRNVKRGYEPENKTGSWGIMAKLRRRDCSFSFDMSRPSMMILPCRASKKRKSVKVSVDLPEPVRPTIPTLARVLATGSGIKITILTSLYLRY
jgi:hypothetical protein